MTNEIERTPVRGGESFRCPNCGAIAGQTWYALGRDDDQSYDSDGAFVFNSDDLVRDIPLPKPPKLVPAAHGWDAINVVLGAAVERMRSGTWAQAYCASCHRYSTWRGDRLIYPALNTLPLVHDDMPGDVVELYNEARAVAPVSRRAGAAMARSTLEALLRSLLPDADRVPLAGLIDLVYPKVSSGLDELLTYIRHVGNSSVHVDEVPDDATVLVLDASSNEAMEAIFEAMNELVDELVTKPKKTTALTGAIPEEVLKGVRERRAKRERQGR